VTTTTPPKASEQDGTYPRPQLMRFAWQDLTGQWEFAFGSGAAVEPVDVEFDRRIIVPFPPESPASGIGDTGYHPVVWYRHSFFASDLEAAGLSSARPRSLLNFGAVDAVADVWVNGSHVGRHEGGQTPFHFDVTSQIRLDGENVIVVRALDDPLDVAVPRGKQDWQEEPHAIWYHRTTGIWQPVWIECVPLLHVASLAWSNNIAADVIELELELNERPPAGTTATVQIEFGGALLAEVALAISERADRLQIPIAWQRNGQNYEHLLWSPEHPRLLDARVRLNVADGADDVSSYLGLRSVDVSESHLLLNDRPFYLRAVLAQNYWPESHWAAPSAAALRREVELILSLGFNGARIHQKAEDPRFLFWADRLGLAIWGETASAYEFSPRAVIDLTREWAELVIRDRSHPSVIAWVPLNESWGVQHIAHDPRQRAYSRAIADLTRAIDGTRPVVSNDGWEHTDSDLLTIHDYDDDADSLSRRYASRATIEEMIDDFGPAGRRLTVDGPHRRVPVLLTEFGGVSWTSAPVDGAWGYSTADSPEQFESQVVRLIIAVHNAAGLAGYCYTQLTDTGQETNGLLNADRSPKVPIEELRAAILGRRA
jgi:beta-galactosidase/beta-glucuronidase